jgi:hypothetical protein
MRKEDKNKDWKTYELTEINVKQKIRKNKNIRKAKNSGQ